jgi:hypothetical protein
VILDVKCETQYPSVQATKSGAALKAVPKLSKHLVAYMEGLLAVSPYVNGPFAKGVAEAVAAAALSDLNQLANEPYMAYLQRKLGEWYSEAPRPARKQPAVCLQWTVSCSIVIVLKRNESRPECRPGSGLYRLIHPSYMISISYGI